MKWIQARCDVEPRLVFAKLRLGRPLVVAPRGDMGAAATRDATPAAAHAPALFQPGDQTTQEPTSLDEQGVAAAGWTARADAHGQDEDQAGAGGSRDDEAEKDGDGDHNLLGD